MSEAKAPPTSVTITVDGKEVSGRPGEMVIAVAERAGVYIPRFCYHPRLEPVGMCRMCIVEIDAGRGPALQPACVIPATDGMSVVTNSDSVAKVQDGVLEFLLINHPLDCPVCDKGGECPLQDQTYAFGPGESRYVEEKRHFEKPIPISDLVHIDRERCILCDRCTRFAQDVAGDPLISFIDRGNEMQVNTFPDDPFASYFSGNTVQLCPVGALLATPYRFKARPWDLEQIESTCTTCAVGCRVAVQSSQDEVIRLVGIDSDPVNHGWLCDKGRFAYEATHGERRITDPQLREGAGLEPTSWVDALDRTAAAIRTAIDSGGPGSVAVIGGARLTNEDAYAWSRLAKGVIGTDHVDCQLGDGLPAEAVLGLPRATIDEAATADVVVLLGPDLKEELPVLHLRLRASAVDGRTRIVELTPTATALSPQADARLHYRPGEVASVAEALRDQITDDVGGVTSAHLDLARQVLGLGRNESPGRVVCVLGRPSLAESAEGVVRAAAALADAVPGITFLPALRRGNVMGALDMGLAPGVLPGRVGLDAGREWFEAAWGSVPAERGLDTAGILEAAADGRIGALVLLGADPVRDFPDRQLAREALAAARFVVAVDHFETDSVSRADVVLPAAAAHEKVGTTTNIEGRITRLGKKVTSPGTARPDWMTAVELARRLGGSLPFTTEAEIWTEVEHLAPSHEGISWEVLSDPAWRDGVPAPLPATAVAIGRPSDGETAFGRVEGEGTPVHESLEIDTPEVAGVEHAATRATSVVAGNEPDGGEPPEVEGEPAERPDTDQTRRPAPLRLERPEKPAPLPVLDSYSLRLVSGRRLYDAGTITQASPSLAGLAPAPAIRISPYDADRLGVSTGTTVRVSSARSSFDVAVEIDGGVPRGSAALGFNQPGLGAADLIDWSQTVTDVRVETVS